MRYLYIKFLHRPVTNLFFFVTASTMVVRVATDERPFETPSSDESGLGRSDSPSEDTEPEAALVSIFYSQSKINIMFVLTKIFRDCVIYFGLYEGPLPRGRSTFSVDVGLFPF